MVFTLGAELYLLGFGALRSVFSGRELQDWAEVMVERGLRLRRGLDEELDGWREKEEGVRACWSVKKGLFMRWPHFREFRLISTGRKMLTC